MSKFYISCVLVSSFLLIAGCGRPETKVQKKEPVKEEKEIVTYTVRQMLGAMVRSHPNSKKACYDSKLNMFMMYYGPRPKVGEEILPDRYYGWIALQNVKFYEMSNKTLFVTPQPEKNYRDIYPDVAGLPCLDTPQ